MFFKVSKFLEQLETIGGSHIDQYSMNIQSFYQNVSKRISSSSIYSVSVSTFVINLECDMLLSIENVLKFN